VAYPTRLFIIALMVARVIDLQQLVE
jgi:hypothetical protein